MTHMRMRKQASERHAPIMDALLDVGASQSTLVAVYRHIDGADCDAEPIFRQQLEMAEAKLGSDHPEVAQCVHNLADLYRTLGRYAEALPLFERALTLMSQINGPAHSSVAFVLTNLAALKLAQGNCSEADQLATHAVQILEITFGAEHPCVAPALSNLAAVRCYQGDLSQAVALYKRSVDIWEKVGPDHPAFCANLNNLATVYRYLGIYPEAAEAYLRALRCAQRSARSRGSALGKVLDNYAQLLRLTGRRLEANYVKQLSDNAYRDDTAYRGEVTGRKPGTRSNRRVQSTMQDR